MDESGNDVGWLRECKWEQIEEKGVLSHQDLMIGHLVDRREPH